jgi:hypothetical protein
MPIKLSFRGIDFTVSSPMEAAALARELTEQPPAKRGRPPKKPERTPATTARAPKQTNLTFIAPTVNNISSQDRERTVMFLSAVNQSGPNGIHAEHLMPILGAKHIKGVGSRMGKVNAVLVRIGVKPGDAYENPRTAKGRVFKAGRAIQTALTALRNGG